MPTTTKDEAARTPGDAAPEQVTILYTNWRGETGPRRIVPIAREWFGSSEWHPEPQWLFTAFDVDKEAFRDFARSGVKAWGQAAVDAALASAQASPGVPDSLRETLEFYASQWNADCDAVLLGPGANDWSGGSVGYEATEALSKDAGARARKALRTIATHTARQSAGSGADDDRSCTCHPDDNPPTPCARKFAFSECQAASAAPDSTRTGQGEVVTVPLEPTEAMLNAPLAPGSSITGARYESRRDLRPLIYAAMIGARPTAINEAESATDKALRDIAQQDCGGLQSVYEDGGDADAAVKYLLGQVERRRKIARDALAARPAAPEAQ